MKEKIIERSKWAAKALSIRTKMTQMRLTSGKDQQRKIHDVVGYPPDLLREIYSEP